MWRRDEPISEPCYNLLVKCGCPTPPHTMGTPVVQPDNSGCWREILRVGNKTRLCHPFVFFLYTRKKNVFMGFLLGFFWCLYGVLFFYYSASWGIMFPIQLNCREYAAAGADTAHRHARRLRGRAEQYAGPSSRQAERN